MDGTWKDNQVFCAIRQYRSGPYGKMQKEVIEPSVGSTTVNKNVGHKSLKPLPLESNSEKIQQVK